MLHGFTVGITADRRWDEQAALFERRHASVVHGPTIRTLPLAEESALRTITEQLIVSPPDVVIANTGLGIRSWFGAADSWGLGPALAAALGEAMIFARGPKASGAVHSIGLEVQGRAKSERLAEAVDMALPHLVAGARVAVQVDGSGTTPELDRLRQHRAEVIAVPVYEWKVPTDCGAAMRLARAVIEQRVQAITFTTGPAVRNMMAIAAEFDMADELRTALVNGPIVVGVVGPVCAEAGAEIGLSPERMTMPAAYRLGPLVRAVADRLAEQVVELTIDARRVRIAGTGVVVDEQRIDLSEIEARLLSVLAATPNAVFSKGDLLDKVWDGGTDEHAVEVAVARLRRRLGPLGSNVRVVHRRGYTLRSATG